MNNVQEVDLSILDKSRLPDIVQEVMQNRKTDSNLILNQLKTELKQWVEVDLLSWKEITEVLEKAYNVRISGQKISKFYNMMKGIE